MEMSSVSERVYPTLVWLIQQRYLEPLTAKHYLTLENRYGALQKEALASHQAPSAKQKREAERGALVEFWDAVEEERDNAYARLTAGLQEALEEMGDGYGGGRPGKRRKYEDADDGLDSRGPGVCLDLQDTSGR